MLSIIVLLLFCVTNIAAYDDDFNSNIILKYFLSDEIKEMYTTWNTHKTAIEDAVQSAIENSIGFTGMNVLIKTALDKKLLAAGYWHNDNHVQLVLNKLLLDDVPRFRLPKVTINLAENLVKVESRLSKMIITAEYMLLRNEAKIVSDLASQNASVTSPFLFEQVATNGELAIVVDNCMLKGYAIATLSGNSVGIGYHYFNLSDCDYSVEIYQLGSASPPVFASYYPIGGGLTLEHLLMKPINAEFIPKLQSALFSTANTSVIFEELLPRLKSHQKNIFRNVTVYMTSLVRNLNNAVRGKSGGLVDVTDIPKLVWCPFNFHISYTNQSSEPLFHKLAISGLDTAYSPNTGGPFKLDYSNMIGEQIRFTSIRVVGEMKANQNLAAEIRDMAVDFEIEVEKPLKIRNLEIVNFGTIGFMPNVRNMSWIEPVILGFIQNKLPDIIIREVRPAFQEALEKTFIGDGEVVLPGKYGSLNSEVAMISVPYPINDETTSGDPVTPESITYDAVTPQLRENDPVTPKPGAAHSDTREQNKGDPDMSHGSDEDRSKVMNSV